MTDDGFVGRYEVVEPRRGNRRWPNDVKARIVAESFVPGARVIDVARRHDIVANQLSLWRRQVRDGRLALPIEVAARSSETVDTEPAFVPLAIASEPDKAVNVHVPQLSEGTSSVLTLEISCDVVIRVPGGVPVERVAALIRAMRGPT